MLQENAEGGFVFIPALSFASAGVVSMPGMGIERVAFAKPQVLQQGIEAMRRHLDRIGRPAAALCGVELRMPAVLDWDGFERFNIDYLARLEACGLARGGPPPFARTNV